MNHKLLKVLEQLEMGDEASLICELPRHLLKEVNVDEAGQVDLMGLLAVCKHLSSAEVESSERLAIQDEEAFEKSAFWYRMIYDRSLAVDPPLGPKFLNNVTSDSVR